MLPDAQIDFSSLLPSKRHLWRVAAVILGASLIIGLLLGLCIFYWPHGALADELGKMFVAGGPAVFSAPGGGLVALEAGFVWGICLAFVAAFIYTAWLIYSVTKRYNDLVAQEKMKAYRRTIEGKRPDRN